MWPFSRSRPVPFNTGELREYILEDGTRLFAELWETKPIDDVYAHAKKLKGADLDPLPMQASDRPPSFTFRYQGFVFTVSQRMGEYWFLVSDPACDSDTLLSVARHFNNFLRRARSTGYIVGFGRQ